MKLRKCGRDGWTLEVPNDRKLSSVAEIIDFAKSEKQIQASHNDFKLVISGRVLGTDASLQPADLSRDSVIHVLVRPGVKAQVTPVHDIPANVADVVRSFQNVLGHVGYPSGEKLRKLINNSDSFNAFVATIPGLAADSVAVAMLKDLQMLKHYLKVDNIAAIKDDHPALLVAVNQLNANISQDVSALSQLHSSLYANSDGYDDDDDEDMDTDQTPIGQPGFSAPTTQQPAAARPQPITADFLSQVLNTVAASRATSGSATSTLGGATNAANPGLPVSEEQPISMEEAVVIPQELVAQLMELGIDEERARRALQMTQGNVNQALDLLFSGEM